MRQDRFFIEISAAGANLGPHNMAERYLTQKLISL